MPASSSAWRCLSRPGSILTPRAASTSAVPDLLVIARLPCLATFSPPPAATKPTAVEMFRVCRPSPPVPQTSTVSYGRSRWIAARRMARAQATISPTVSPRRRMAVTAAATWAGVGSPRRQALKKSSASASDRVAPSARRPSRGLKASDTASDRFRALDAGKVEEVGQQVVAAFGGDGLGVELHAVHRPGPVLEAHDLAVVGPGGDFQDLGQALF